jgi:glycosyltransferase involved in cell wall biosynthesis
MNLDQNFLVSIYIVSKNYGKYLSQAIKSVLKQSYKNWELFIIDDNSNDDTLKIARRFYNKNKKIKKIFSYKKNQGLQFIANKVLEICDGKYIIRLDADDWLNENALLLLVNKANSNKNIGAVFGNYLFANEKSQIIGFDYKNNFDNFYKNKIIAPHGACTLFKTEDIKKIGGYSEDINSQDGWEIWYKLNGKKKIDSVNNIIFYYRQHETSVSKKKNLLLSRNKIVKKLTKSIFGNYKLKTFGVIGVKENYPDVKNVPFLKFKNKNLLDWGIESALRTKLKYIVIATSSKKVIEYLRNKRLPKNIFIVKRSKNLEKSASSIEELLSFCGQKIIKQKKITPDVMVFLSMHTIRFNVDHVDRSVDLLKLNNFDTIFSVTKETDPMFIFENANYKLLNRGRFKNLDYASQNLARFNGSLIASWWRVIINNKLFNNNFGVIELNSKDYLQINNLKNFF